MAITFEHTTLDNGLTIIAETDPDAASVGAGFFVKTGSRDEDAGVMGVSHFLEHMMFKGTDTISAAELNAAFDGIGASNNAYTSREMTCFYAHVIPEQSGRAIGLLGEMMRPALRVDDFDMEKGVILEEIAMYADNPFFELYERVLEKHYGAHPLGHRVLGTNESIKALSAEQMGAYFRDRYSADNTVVALSGRLDFGAAVEQIAGVCGSWERMGPGRDAGRPGTSGGRFEERLANVHMGYFLRVAPGPGVRDDDRYAAALAAQVLGGEDNSRLHWALIESGIADEALAAYEGLDGSGEFLVYASGQPDRIGRIEEIVRETCASLADSIEEDDLAKLRARMLTSVTLGGERPSGRMQRLGRQWTMTGERRSLEEEIALINAVDVDAVRRVLSRYPVIEGTSGTMLPEG